MEPCWNWIWIRFLNDESSSSKRIQDPLVNPAPQEDRIAVMTQNKISSFRTTRPRVPRWPTPDGKEMKSASTLISSTSNQKKNLFISMPLRFFYCFIHWDDPTIVVDGWGGKREEEVGEEESKRAHREINIWTKDIFLVFLGGEAELRKRTRRPIIKP